jgi:transposase
MPGFSGRCRQLSEARADNPWLAEGSVIVQQQAVRDHDRAMAVSAALSTGELLHCPGLAASQQERLRRLERKLARAARGSERRKKVRRTAARLKARGVDIRKDWCEKTSTDIAERFDLIRVEDLKIGNMTRSAKR